MPRKSEWQKIRIPGFVTLHQRGNEFRIRYQDNRGKDTKRILPCDTLPDALEIVRGYNREIASGKHVPGLKSQLESGLPVNQALETAINASNASDYVKEHHRSNANMFLQWLAEHKPTATVWSSITPEVIRDYAKHLETIGRAADTIRNRLAPLSLASRYWYRKMPTVYHDVKALANIRLDIRPHQDPATLSADQLTGYLNWLRVNRPIMYPMAVLAATTGMRLLEVATLRYCDVNWAQGTITITKTPWHTPKTASSYRTIPVPRITLQILSDWVKNQSIQDASPEACLFLDPDNNPWVIKMLNYRWRKACDSARNEIQLPPGFTTRRLRATYQTMAIRGGVSELRLRRYVGHSGGSMLETHYLAHTLQDMREEVIKKVEPTLTKILNGSNLEPKECETLK